MANGRRVAFVPPAGAVQEFKVETASFDAAAGPHRRRHRQRDAEERHQRVQRRELLLLRDETLSATDFFVEKAERGPSRSWSYKRFGGNAGGPSISGLQRPRPHVLLRRHRVALRPVPGARSVHGADRSDAQRRLLGSARRRASPSTTRRPPQLVDGRVVAHAVPGQRHSANRINPIARNDAEVLPAAEPGGQRQGQNNYFSDNPRTDDFYSISTRVDHRLTDKQQIFVRYTRNNRRRVAQRLFRRGQRHRARPATSSSASTTASPPTTSTR